LAASAIRHPADPLDLVLSVDQRVEALALVAALADPPRLTKVDATGQLANDEQVESGDQLRLEARRVDQLRPGLGGPEVGEDPELGAQPQQTPLGAQIRGKLVPLRPPHGGQQQCVRLACEPERRLRQRIPGLVVGLSSDRRLFDLDVELARGPQGLEQLDGLGRDLRTDPIAR
jgi:hypothetical protein